MVRGIDTKCSLVNMVNTICTPYARGRLRWQPVSSLPGYGRGIRDEGMGIPYEHINHNLQLLQARCPDSSRRHEEMIRTYEPTASCPIYNLKVMNRFVRPRWVPSKNPGRLAQATKFRNFSAQATGISCKSLI